MVFGLLRQIVILHDQHQIQSTLGFTTRGLAVDLALATGRAVTDLRQYINSDLVLSDLKFGPLFSAIATVKVIIPNGLNLANIAFYLI